LPDGILAAFEAANSCGFTVSLIPSKGTELAVGLEVGRDDTAVLGSDDDPAKGDRLTESVDEEATATGKDEAEGTDADVKFVLDFEAARTAIRAARPEASIDGGTEVGPSSHNESMSSSSLGLL
jgi:hypothetical protein